MKGYPVGFYSQPTLPMSEQLHVFDDIFCIEHGVGDNDRIKAETQPL